MYGCGSLTVGSGVALIISPLNTRASNDSNKHYACSLSITPSVRSTVLTIVSCVAVIMARVLSAENSSLKELPTVGFTTVTGVGNVGEVSLAQEARRRTTRAR